MKQKSRKYNFIDGKFVNGENFNTVIILSNDFTINIWVDFIVAGILRVFFGPCYRNNLTRRRQNLVSIVFEQNVLTWEKGELWFSNLSR